MASDFLLLNLMWLVACLPVVTILPATAALFGVVRDRVRGKEGGLLSAFVARFKENLVQSLVVGVVWMLFGVVLFLDFLVANQLPYGARVALEAMLVLASSLYAFGSVFLFPVMVHYEAGPKTIIKHSLLLSVAKLPTTLACLVIVLVAAALTVVFPFLLIIAGSTTAYVVYRLCDREFRKIDPASGNA